MAKAKAKRASVKKIVARKPKKAAAKRASPAAKTAKRRAAKPKAQKRTGYRSADAVVKLGILQACDGARSFVASRRTFEAAWNETDRADWIIWLLVALARRGLLEGGHKRLLVGFAKAFPPSNGPQLASLTRIARLAGVHLEVEIGDSRNEFSNARSVYDSFQHVTQCGGCQSDVPNSILQAFGRDEELPILRRVFPARQIATALRKVK